jgi:uncharacterized protein (TIRG00374 family)
MTRRSRLGFWLGIALSAVCLFLAFRKVSLTELGAALNSASLLIVGVAAGVYISSLLVRALRWQVLLSPLRRPWLLDLLSYIMIGYLANALLPFRLGDIARTVYAGEKWKESKSGIMATVAVERILDILSLTVLFLLLGLIMDIPVEVKQVAWIMSGVAVSGAVVLWTMSLPGGSRWAKRITDGIVPVIPHGIRQRAMGIANAFVTGLQVLHTRDRLFRAAAYSLVVWGLLTVSISLFLKSFDLSLPWYAPMLTVVALNLGALVPSSPGAIGVAHLLIMLSLSPWGVERSLALSVAIVIHGVALAINILLGLAALWQESITFASLRRVGHTSLVPSSPGQSDQS